MHRKEFVKRLYNRIANNKGEQSIQLDSDDFAECFCNISDDGKK